MRDEVLARDQLFLPEELTALKRAADWMPDRIFDCHAHNFLHEHVRTVPARMRSHIINTYSENSVDDSVRMRSLLFPDRQVSSLRFSHAMPGVSFTRVNEWLQSAIDNHDRFALFGLQNDVPYTLRALELLPTALKQYYLVTDPPGSTIEEVFPPDVLEACQALKIPIICHLPIPLPASLSDVLNVIARFPRLIVILAHAGVALLYSTALEEAYSILSRYENVYFDTALVDDAAVMSALLQRIPIDRILFGSDEPLNFLRAETYIHPTLGPRLAPRTMYDWTDREEYREFGSLGSNAVQWHWSALRAIRDAVAAMPSGAQDDALASIFFDNASELFRLPKREVDRNADL